MRGWLVGLLLLSCAWLTAMRVPAWQSDRALWWAALPSDKPRVLLNVSAALIRDGDYQGAALWAHRAVWMAQQPERRGERELVLRLVQNQLRWIDLWQPVCDRPAYSPYC